MSAKAKPVSAIPRRAALYLRVSTGRQAENDLSIPDQRRQLQSYCQAKGISIEAEFVEPGASATDDRRLEFQRMMDAASQKPAPFDAIVVHSFSRFFRDQFQLEFYVRRLAKSGIRLTSITQDLGDDPMSVMMRQIMALFDEYQSKENAKHTLRAMKENARQGYWNGSRPPYGYKIVASEQRGARMKKKIEPDPDQTENVRLMFRLALVGNEHGPMGGRQIANFLNSRGIRTQTGGRWGVGAVHQVLSRTTYIGLHRFNVYSWRKKLEKPDDEIVEVAVPPIIGADEFEAVQEMMRSRSPQFKAPRFVSAGTLLGGVCFCAECGGAMTLRTSGKGAQYRYYTCCTTARQGKTGCKGRTVPMDELNDLVVSYLEDRLLAPERIEILLTGLLRRREERVERQRARITELRKQAADAEGKLTRLYEAIENGLAQPDDQNLKGRIAELMRIRDSARADADRADGREKEPDARISPEALSRFADAARERLRSKDGSFRRHHLQMLVQRIEVGDDEIRIKGSKTKLLQTLVASGGVSGGNSATNGVRSFVPNWLREQDSNLRPFD
ncbi:recombinase family protein [Pinisolibacter aquiterrae]|uniref:recombinase family protein n=1 Tax=Pinisolibacter aquiterrae TaxID=2815579 RepID=UPI001C3C5139|nr:recombinase family protein [Pinisolibacter aquiterrae]MBV5265010.1 recombinase family protein [Pinisolibacter aquiterrae]MCC8235608.1 recombinase family protein [Pinisolibacter aquiterrae]